MGLAVPRPAMRSRETRVIQARLKYYSERTAELIRAGDAEASTKAFREAKALKFNRKGELQRGKN